MHQMCNQHLISSALEIHFRLQAPSAILIFQLFIKMLTDLLEFNLSDIYSIFLHSNENIYPCKIFLLMFSICYGIFCRLMFISSIVVWAHSNKNFLLFQFIT